MMLGYLVLISIDFSNYISALLYSLVFVSIKKIFQTVLRQCFIGYPNTLSFFKNTLLHVIFSTLFLVFGYSLKTLSLMFDILLGNIATRKRSSLIRIIIWQWTPANSEMPT